MKYEFDNYRSTRQFEEHHMPALTWQEQFDVRAEKAIAEILEMAGL